MNLSVVHHSWKPILREFSTDAFLIFKNKILRENKYYPEADEVFRIFSMPFYDIRVVMIDKIANSSLSEQGVFILPLSLTRGVDIDHDIFWKPFIKKVVFLIAKYNQCIWLLGSTKAQAFTANMPIKSIFNVQGYDDSTIHHIPNNNYNYIFKGKCINLEYVNIILSKRGQKTINW